MSLLDGRFLTGRSERTVPGALRYINKLLELTAPTTVVIDAPGSDGSTIAADIRREVEHLLSLRRISMLTLDRTEILSAFGVTRIVDRRELRDLIAILWPDMERIKGQVRPFVADAAAGALVAECRVELEGGL
jgi:hypothetical protein